MSTPTTNNGRGVRRPLRRLDHGHELLERWSSTASQTDRNAVYKTLFAVLEGSVRDTHIVLDGSGGAAEYAVLVRESLVVDIRVDGDDSFTLVAIGAPGQVESP